MGTIQLRERWRRQPDRAVGIDWSHPSAAGLLYAGGVPIASRGGSDGSSFFERTDGLLANLAGPRGSLHGYYLDNVPPRVSTPYGLASYFNGDTDVYTTGKAYTLDLTGVANGAASNESCLVICTPEQSTGSQNIMGFSTVFSSSLSDYGRGIGIESGQFMAWGASASNGKRLYGTLTTLGRPVVLAARFATDGFLMVNGVVVASGDMSHSWGYKFAVGNAIATVESNAIAPFKGAIGMKYWWRRGCSAGELSDLSRELWGLIQPRVTPIFFTAGGATSGAGASAGAGAASATSQATWAAVGASVGAGTGAATSQATWAAVGASAGAGAASATGTDANGGISSATAASSGAGAASATSQATWAAVGASAGAGTGAATSRTVAASIGASASAGTGAATSRTVAASIGASAGTGAAAATGDDANSAFSSATAASSGTGAAAATSRATWATVAASVATSSVAATANAVWAGVGASTGTATASADGATSSAVQAAVGSATGSATGSAVARIVAAVAGAAAGAAVASGVSDALSAVVEAAGAAVAVAVASAAAHAIWNAVGSSAGSTTASGASPVTLDAAAVARQIVVRTMEAVVVVTSRGLASKVVTDG